jgi:RNA polymerase sigma-70 factor, ECF subfamily
MTRPGHFSGQPEDEVRGIDPGEAECTPSPSETSSTAVSESRWAALQTLFLASFDDLARRLTRRLRSAELVSEALQETYLRLERGGELAEVHQPNDFLYQIALNIARDHLRTESRRLTRSEMLEAVLETIDVGPTPERIAESRSDMAAMTRALEELSPRRRAMFLAAWVQEEPRESIAARFGVSMSTLKSELKMAREHVAQRLRQGPEKVVQLPLRKTSHE